MNPELRELKSFKVSMKHAYLLFQRLTPSLCSNAISKPALCSGEKHYNYFYNVYYLNIHRDTPKQKEISIMLYKICRNMRNSSISHPSFCLSFNCFSVLKICFFQNLMAVLCQIYLYKPVFMRGGEI